MWRVLEISLTVASLIALVVNAQPENVDSGELFELARNTDGTLRCADDGQNTTVKCVSLAQCTAGCRSDASCLSYNHKKPTTFEPKTVCEMFSIYPCYNGTAGGCTHYESKIQPPRPECPVGCAICCTGYGQLMACRFDGCIAGYLHDGVNGSCISDVNECLSNPCKNGATCVNGINYFSCTCVSGYSGANCETDINECLSNPCMNGATCLDGINYFSCTCRPGYTGVSCETDLNECDSNPCLNGGTCINNINYYTCTCTSSFNGSSCQNIIPNELYITGDDYIKELFFDGSAYTVTSLPYYAVWYMADHISLSPTTSLIAVSVTNGAISGAVLASDSHGHITDASWKCTAALYTNWHLTTYDDSFWLAAWVREPNNNTGSVWGQLYGSQPIANVAGTASWIWAQGASEFTTVYCRAHLI